jgi:hypothetical protein
MVKPESSDDPTENLLKTDHSALNPVSNSLALGAGSKCPQTPFIAREKPVIGGNHRRGQENCFARVNAHYVIEQLVILLRVVPDLLNVPEEIEKARNRCTS